MRGVPSTPRTQRTQSLGSRRRASVRSERRISFVSLVSFVLIAAANSTDWPSHDGDAAGQRFSPLKQITPANVSKLEQAWVFDTGATGIQGPTGIQGATVTVTPVNIVTGTVTTQFRRIRVEAPYTLLTGLSGWFGVFEVTLRGEALMRNETSP